MKKILRIFSVIFLGALIVLTLLNPLFDGGTGLEQNIDSILMGPGGTHWFGTDSLGRDVFARVLLGGRVSLVVGLVCSLLSFILGFSYGAVAGWFEGLTDRMMMRLLDILMAIPSFILVSVIVLSLQLILPLQDAYWKALVSLCIGISATHWMGMARVTRGMVLEVRRKPFVEAAIALGGRRSHILLRHILPNILGSLLILMALQIPTNILYESFMSFVGLGIQPPYTSWGILVREGWKTLSSFPHLILFPSLILFLTVWSFHIVLDWLREVFKV